MVVSARRNIVYLPIPDAEFRWNTDGPRCLTFDAERITAVRACRQYVGSNTFAAVF